MRQDMKVKQQVNHQNNISATVSSIQGFHISHKVMHSALKYSAMLIKVIQWAGSTTLTGRRFSEDYSDAWVCII